MKKRLLTLTLALLPLMLTGCENQKVAGGNEMVTGTKTFNYALVHSQITGDKYYHIKGWKEYGPEGITFEGGTFGQYVGLELQLAVSQNVVYYYEPGLMYFLSQNYDATWGRAIE